MSAVQAVSDVAPVARPVARSRPAGSPGEIEVAAAIRRRIVSGELIPGQRLVEADLRELLGASRRTVRAALMDLMHEGLVERIANHSARVRVVGLEEALHISELRLALESLCVARAAERITEEEIGRMRALAAQLAAYAAEGALEGFAETTDAIFRLYVGIADQPVAREMLEQLRARTLRHRFRLADRAARVRVATPFWVATAEAICARDAVAAVAALGRHARNVQESLRALGQGSLPFAMPYHHDRATRRIAR